MSERGNHHDGNRRDDHREQRRDPLKWQEDDRVQVGSVIGTINSAERSDGTRIFSWCIGKESRRDDRVLKFMDPRDIENAHKVLDDIKCWIDDEQSAEHKP